MENHINNRSFERISVRTFVKIVAASPPHRVYKAWTDDLSPSGARILCEEEIQVPLLYLQVMIPELQDRFIVGDLVWADPAFLPRLRGSGTELHSYGVRFTGICEVSDVLPMIKSATTGLV